MAEQLRAALARATRTLAAAGVDNPRLDAALLLAEALGSSRDRLLGIPDRPLAWPERAAYDRLIGRRQRREPLSHVIGRREFHGLTFQVSAAVLDPRPDSESLIEAALAEFPAASAPRLVDLGCGSGCLMLSLLAKLPGAFGLGIDLSPAAIDIARTNARQLGLASRAVFAVSDWAGAVAGRLDLILSNPPYIASAVLPTLAPEVALHEPRLALDGGADGLGAYRRILPDLPRLLVRTGVAVLECGQGQAADIVGLAQAQGLVLSRTGYDLAGVKRALVFRLG